MPLILVTGLPSSGKSTTSEEILNYLRNKLEQAGDSRQVRIVSDNDTLDWDGRNSIFTSILKEKELRGWLRAEAQRYVNLNQIVILDAAVYIKGFRYELFCMSKEAKTQYCVVEKLLDQELCWKWNQDRLDKFNRTEANKDDEAPNPAYDRSVFEALILRYEKCDEENRWDAPLFRVTSDNKDELDLERIHDTIINQDPLAPNKCTLTSTSTSTMFKPPK